jgi:hypothetical protein
MIRRIPKMNKAGRVGYPTHPINIASHLIPSTPAIDLCSNIEIYSLLSIIWA